MSDILSTGEEAAATKIALVQLIGIVARAHSKPRAFLDNFFDGCAGAVSRFSLRGTGNQQVLRAAIEERLLEMYNALSVAFPPDS